MPLIPSASEPALPRRRHVVLSWSWAALRVAIVLVLALWSLLLLAWLTLHWGILPHIDDWRGSIETRASAALGVPVRIGRITVSSSGWVPALQLTDVVLADREGREALRLPRVAAAVSPQSLLTLRLTFSQLYIEGAQLEVRRDRQGRLHVAGLDVDPSASVSQGSGAGADWFFQQREFVIRQATVRWVDELREAPPLVLSQTDLVVRNGLRDHDLRLDATPPPAWGERFSLVGRFSQPLLARAGDWQRWSGNLHANLPRADVANLRRHVDLPFDLRAGDGALRLWMDLAAGEWRQATLDVALDEVNLRLASALEPLALSKIHARLSATRTADGLSLKAEGLRFTTDDEVSWPASQLSLRWRQNTQPVAPGQPAQPVLGGELSADRLDLALMARIASRVPLPDAVRRALGEMAPQGQVLGLQVSWVGAPEQPRRFRVQARGTGLSIAAKPAAQAGLVGRPGWRNAELNLDANETGGEARLMVKDGALEFPGVFEDPLVPLDRFGAKLVWHVRPVAPAAARPAALDAASAPAGAREPGPAWPLSGVARTANGAPAAPEIELLVQDAQFSNADAQGELQARWHTGPGEGFGVDKRYPGRIELSGVIQRGQAVRVARYLPLGIAAEARDYVGRAVRGGSVSNTQFRVRGDLWEFPFGRGVDGDFRISAQAENVELAYVPAWPGDANHAPVAAWPAFTQVNGELIFDRTSMQVRDARAQLWGIELSGVNGGIRDLVNQATLEIAGRARGPLADALRYVNATPLGGWTGQALREASGSGVADLQLALNIPLHDSERSTVKGSVTLAGNDVRLRPDVPLLAGARGRVDFTQRGFTVVGATARALGGELSLDGGTQADGSVRLAGQGVASADGLRRAPELGLLARLASSASGQAPYRLQLGLLRGQMELQVNSSLSGLALDLPAPLRKPAEQAWPLRYQTSLLPEAAGAPVRDTLRLDLGTVLQAEYQRDLSGEQPRVLRGMLAVGGEPLPAPVAGQVQAAARLAQLDVDAWQAVAERWWPAATAAGAAPGAALATAPGAATALPGLGTTPQAAATTAAAAPTAQAGAAGGGAAASTVASPLAYLPGDISLRAQSLQAGGRRLTQLTANLQRRAANAPLAGEWWRAELRADQAEGSVEYRPATAGASARVQARLSRLALPPSEAEALDSLADTSRPSVPALDIVVDDFELRGKKLGRLEIEAEHRGADRREWRLARLNLSTPEARLTSSGSWTGGSTRRMALDFRVDLSDSGAFVERLGMGRTVKGGKGRLQGQLAWTGSPLAPEWSRMTGSMQMALDSGQFLKAEPGAARLLGVLSLQSLPRRLTLDFRDVFQEGFAFDNVSGDVKLADGVARTNNLRIRGLQAVVLVEGQADLKRETQNLRMFVVPEINAGTASLAYAAINPAIGLGTFLAQYVLRKPLQQAGTREFVVTGSWDKPQVEPVDRKLGEPLPEGLDAPAAAASLPAATP